jgi:hypothetical protein
LAGGVAAAEDGRHPGAFGSRQCPLARQKRGLAATAPPHRHRRARFLLFARSELAYNTRVMRLRARWLSQWFLLGSIGGSLWLHSCPASAAQVRRGPFAKWPESLFINSDNNRVRLVIAPAVGGRIVHYSAGGENILYEHMESIGKTLATTPGGFWVGGYQCDVGPEIRGIPEHFGLWIGPYQAETPNDYTVVVRSEPDAQLGLRLEKHITLSPDTGEVGIVQRMVNVSDRETAFCLWDRTLCQGGGYALVPLNKKSRLPARWALARTVDGKMRYDGDTPESAQARVMDGVLVIKAEGPATKIGADSDAGWVAYARGKTLFVKFYPYTPAGPYTDGGNSVEVYWDERFAELEPLSPEVKLAPHASYEFPEKWVLIELRREVTSYEQARSAVSKVPDSPFRR